MIKNLFFLMTASIFVLVGCKKDEKDGLLLKKSEITLNSKQTENISISPSSEGCTFTSENKYIAVVNNKGVVTGLTVGTTYINISNPNQNFNAKCKITVAPVLHLFKEPCLEFGTTKANIKSKESRTLAIKDAQGVLFVGENSSVQNIGYLFDGAGKMTSAFVLVPGNKMITALDFLTERYISIGYEDGVGVLISNNEKILVGTSIYNTSILLITYSVRSSQQRSACREDVNTVNTLNWLNNL